MLKLLLLLTILPSVTGFVQLYVVGVPDANHTNINWTLAREWCNAPVSAMQTGAGLQHTPVKTVVIAGKEDSIFVCAWLHNVTAGDIGLYNFTGHRPPVELGEMISESMWGVDCRTCYNFTDKPFTECFCGNHSSGCTHRCTCTGGWFGPSCEYDPKYRSYCQNGGSYGEANGHPYCSCRAGFNGSRCEHRVVNTKFSSLQAATSELTADCATSLLCIVSLLGNIFLLFVLGWMLYSNRRQPQQELFLYHSLEQPGAPRPLLVTEM